MCSKLLSLTRMSRRLDVTQAWLREQAAAGLVPHLKAGDRYLFNPVAVEDVLSERASQVEAAN